jgi:hypothetical protein
MRARRRRGDFVGVDGRAGAVAAALLPPASAGVIDEESVVG